MAIGACVCAAILGLITLKSATTSPDLKIKVTAHQWWWEFDYPSLDVKTSDVLYLPSSSRVELELISADVIHSFWIVGMKDSVKVVPGKTRVLDLNVTSPGELYGNCDSGCGCASVCMRFRVLAQVESDFHRWAAGARLSRSDFKPPQHLTTPECALADGGASHSGGKRRYPATRLQRLFDASTPN